MKTKILNLGLAFITLILLTFAGLHSALAQDSLTNGWTSDGAISPIGDSDSWTFLATNGDSIVIRVGEITGTNSFTPRIRLLNPSAVQIASASGSLAAEIAVTAADTGTFTVIVDDANGTGTAAYRLTLAKSGGAVFVAPGDEGGPMTNGVMHTGTILTGDLDVWTFSANAGEGIVVRMGEITDTNAFTPWVRLYSPSGALVDSGFGSLAGEVTVTASNTGTYLVVVGDGNNNPYSGSGAYRLTLAKTGSAVVTSPGDEGGPMTNGVMHTGTILTGDLDVWTFSANAGESIVVRMGEITDTNAFTPWVRLYSPTGALVDSGFGSLAGEVTVTASNTGAYLVVVGDGNNNPYSGSGAYRLTLAKTGSAVVTSPGDEGGPMTNGVMHTGTILTGDLDVWTFSANAWEGIVVRMGEITDTNAFTPWVRLYSPSGALVDSGFGSLAGEVTVTASNTGAYLVVVGDGNNNPYSGSGAYRLTLAKTGSAVVTSPGDEGGPMTNGVMHTGTILTGDLDVWTFSANTGESIVVRMGEITDTNAFTPWVRLYSPSGALVDSGFGSLAGEVTVTASNTGAYLVVVGDGNNNPYSGSGAYRLTLAKTGSAVVTSPGDEGGPMTNGVMHTGTILTGDLDVWTFSANAGESIVVRMGEITDTNAFTPWVRLYSPTGALVDSGFGSLAGEVTVTASNTGAYLVVVGDGNNNPYSGSGAYRLTLAKTGSAVVTSPGDEGGPMTNGVMHTGTILTGDLDVWTFSANAGDGLVVRMGGITDTNAFTPWVRLYGPSGALLDSGFGAAAGEVAVPAGSSGAYLVVVGDGNNSPFSGTGKYRLTLAKTGSAIVTSAGDEGGPMTGVGVYNGTINVGDLDVWSFTTFAGDKVVLRMDEVTATNGFTPWVRLYGPGGALVASDFGSPSAGIAIAAGSSGNYLVVAGDGNNNPFSGSGAYTLTVNGLSDGLKLSKPKVSGTNVNFAGAGGAAGATFVVLSTTNLTTPAALWTPILTNQFDALGVFSHTNHVNPAERQRYFRLFLP